MLQKNRKSGFGASDELSSDEEDGVQPLDVIRLLPQTQREERNTKATHTTAFSIRKRTVKSYSKL